MARRSLTRITTRSNGMIGRVAASIKLRNATPIVVAEGDRLIGREIARAGTRRLERLVRARLRAERPPTTFLPDGGLGPAAPLDRKRVPRL
jgi:hypothetical protein